MVKKALALLFLISAGFISCEESLPPLVTNVPQLSVELAIFGENPKIRYNDISEKIGFVFTVTNHSDEAIEDPFFFSGTIHCEPTTYCEPFSIDFAVERNTYLAIPPGMQYSFTFAWDQRLEDGSYLFQKIPSQQIPYILRMSAQASVQVFKKFGNLQTDKLNFNVLYEWR